MGRTLFISDLHFGHKNVMIYENRPFSSVEEMDQKLIEYWNETVKRDDTVYFLGDFSLKGGTEYLGGIISQLEGNKIMIYGNHDHKKPEFYVNAGFKSVSRRPIILKSKFILSHEPLPQMELDKSLFFYVYGHVHSSPAYETYTSNSVCACCERHNYRPFTIPEYDRYAEPRFENPAEEGRE